MTKEDIKMGENSSFVWLIFCVGGGVPLLIFFNIVMVILYYFHRKNVISDMDVVYEDIHKIFLKSQHRRYYYKSVELVQSDI
jgi:hypothetical protein